MAMRDFLSVTKALSDESRVRVLMAVAGGELCVCQIIKLLGLAPSTVSKHVAILHQAYLVETRKDGRWIYYRLADDEAACCVPEAVAMARTCLAGDKRIDEDAKRLKTIRETNRDALCVRYHN